MTKRSVSFAPTESMNSINFVLHRADYGDDERYSCWYDGVDIQIFKRDLGNDAKRAIFWKGNDENKLCKRGLEIHSPKGSRIRKRAVKASRKAVLEAQQVGCSNDMCDDESSSSDSSHQDEFLAQVYQSFSIPSQNLAHERALILKVNCS